MSYLKQQNSSTISVEGTVEQVFAAVVAAGKTVGTVRERSKVAGYVVINTPMQLFPPLNPATVRVSVKKAADSQVECAFFSDSLDGAIGFGSAGKAIDAIVRGLEKTLPEIRKTPEQREREREQEARRQAWLADRIEHEKRQEEEDRELARARAAARAARVASVAGACWSWLRREVFGFGWYRALPEVLQPVVWGLGVAIPVVLVIVLWSRFGG
jgi:hypothetical protein